MGEPERDFLICATADGEAVAGSIVRNCERCDVRVWVAPSGQRTIIERGPSLEVVCIPCGLGEFERDPATKVGPVTSEQIAELRAFVRARRRRPPV